MGYKLVRDNNKAWCRANGIPGQWRISPDPAAALRRKLGEEYLEYAEADDPAELYDLLDALQALIALKDPSGEFAARHHAKVAVHGGFTKFIEWCPVPGVTDDGVAG